MIRYKHTQLGYPALLLMGIILITSLSLVSESGLPNFDIITVIMLIGLSMGAAMTVAVTADTINILFGLGPIRVTLNLNDIEAVAVTNTPLSRLFSFGVLPIWWTPDGIFYNVSIGGKWVRLVMKNGRRYYIGTNEPEKLKAAIDAAIVEGQQ